MLTYKQVVQKIKEGGGRGKELFDKLTEEDIDLIFVSKQYGLFTRIKNNLIEMNTIETEIPNVGRLVINPTTIKKKLKTYIKSKVQFEELVIKPLELKQDIEKHKKNIEDLQVLIEKYTALLIKQYDVYEFDKKISNRTKAKKNGLEMKTEIYVDPIKRDMVLKILSDTKLTTEKFILEMKSLKVPVLKSWFLVAYQSINGLIEKRQKATMSKPEFKKILEEGGLYVESI